MTMVHFVGSSLKLNTTTRTKLWEPAELLFHFSFLQHEKNFIQTLGQFPVFHFFILNLFYMIAEQSLSSSSATFNARPYRVCLFRFAIGSADCFLCGQLHSPIGPLLYLLLDNFLQVNHHHHHQTRAAAVNLISSPQMDTTSNFAAQITL